MQRHRRTRQGSGGQLTPSKFGQFSWKFGYFSFGQKVGDQFTLRIASEMDPHFWSKSIDLIKFYVWNSGKSYLLCPLPPNGKGPVPHAHETIFIKFIRRGGGAKCFFPSQGGREMFFPSQGGRDRKIFGKHWLKPRRLALRLMSLPFPNSFPPFANSKLADLVVRIAWFNRQNSNPYFLRSKY